jgi:peptide/nickel transport system ATP-binding protein/energy-coupling factor transport system ATP-binding protein
LLRTAGLGHRTGAFPGELSGGERQRVALCAALAHRPALLLADEPTAELDEASALDVAGLIDELAEAEGTTVIVVSHDPAMAANAQRAVRIRDGRVVEERIDGGRTLVVGPGGWLRLPAPLLDETGIGATARAEVIGDGVLLRPAGKARRESSDLPPPPATPAARVRPATVALRSVSRYRGRGTHRRAVLEEFSVTFQAGCLTAVTGRSGSGKTTLLELVAGLQAPDAGELVLDGTSMAGADAEQRAGVRRRLIGYLPQEPSPVGFLSAAENVALALRIRGRSAPEAGRVAIDGLARIGLADRSRQRVSRLSAGEAQRVALARAIACADGLLVVDEPTSRLDEASAASVARLLAQTAAENGQTVICATHDPEVMRYADHILELGAVNPGPPRLPAVQEVPRR